MTEVVPGIQSVERKLHAQEEKKETAGRYTKKRSMHTEKKKKKRKKDTGKDREQQAKEEHTTLSGDFISPLSSLNLSLFLFFKYEFLFGKTNKVRFHEELLTPCMKL